jgi:hypothetical protein
MVRPNPAHEELQAVVGRALVDPSFCKGLLNGHRAECLSEYELSNEELAAARRIKATDLTNYASQLDEWILRQAMESRARAVAALPRPRTDGFLSLTGTLPAAA